ncbi:hypothetical protein MMI32_004229 [Klebsiella pneumoniae]|nr:hypothetical protein [Klebsiella pneumoniae]EKX6828581.1 hypothetical protein [Klebsiella pneumoniae]
MTDITELAQSLKAAAIDAKELAIIARYSKGRAAAEKFYAMANPNNVIALVEALEKAQRANAAQGDHIEQQQDRIEQLEKGNQYAAKRIAELESRTVKLPQRHSMLLREDFNEDYHTEMAYKADEVQVSLIAAGIKVEAE